MNNVKKIINICLTLTICLSYSYSSAQPIPSKQWQKCYGGSQRDFNFTGFSFGTGWALHGTWGTQKRIINTSDGGFLFVAGTFSNDGDVIGYHKNEDLWVVKTNSIGIIEWQRCLGSTGTESPASVIQTSDHGYAVIGNILDYNFPNPPINDGDVSGFFGTNNGWLVKLDSTGNLLWQRCFGGGRNIINNLNFREAEMFSIVESNDSGLVVAGLGSSTSEGFPASHGRSEAYIVKFDNTGNLLWQRYYGGSGGDGATLIMKIKNNGFVFVGGTQSDNNGDVSGHHEYIDSSHSPDNSPTTDIWMVQLDSNGVLVRQKCIGGTGNDDAGGMSATTDGGYILTANTDFNDWDFEATGKKPQWIIKLDSAFTVQWKRSIGGSHGREEISSIIQTLDGGYAFLAATVTLDGDVKGIHLSKKVRDLTDTTVYVNETTDIWLVKLLQTGEIEWQKCLGGYDDDFPSEIIQTSDSSFVVLGTTYSNDGDVSGNHGQNDVWVVKLGSGPNSVVSEYGSNYSEDVSKFNIYPNPADDVVSLELYYTQTARSVTFYDICGREYHPQYQLDKNKAIIDVKFLPTGVYVAKLSFSYNNYIGDYTLPLLIRH